MQMDEIHVKSDVTYKGGKIYGSSLSPEDPIKTVFAIIGIKSPEKIVYYSSSIPFVPLFPLRRTYVPVDRRSN